MPIIRFQLFWDLPANVPCPSPSGLNEKYKLFCLQLVTDIRSHGKLMKLVPVCLLDWTPLPSVMENWWNWFLPATLIGLTCPQPWKTDETGSCLPLGLDSLALSHGKLMKVVPACHELTVHYLSKAKTEMNITDCPVQAAIDCNI